MGHVSFEDTPPLIYTNKRSVEISSPCEFKLEPEKCVSSSSSFDSAASIADTVVFGGTRDTQETTLEEIWREYDSFTAGESAFVPDADDESEDSDVELFAPQRKRESVMGKLPCGDIHICRLGKPCPFLEPNEDRVMVCIYTGLEHGPEHTDEFFDLNGGSGKKSGDPDQNCGELLHGKWTKRVDPTQASKLAFQYSNKISDDDVFDFVADSSTTRVLKGQLKRGALCVGEECEEQALKKSRGGKKNVGNQETASHLHSEAALVITKMIDHKKASSFKNKAPPGKIERKCAPIDVRMCDQNFVFQKSLQRYIKSCLVKSTAPSIDAIHNLTLMAQEVSQKTKKQQEAIKSTDSIRTVKFRGLCSSLIVSLWSAACKTPYMSNAKRGTDAYRPFVCGVLYGFKRGIKLDNGDILVPQCPQLSEALPVLRGTGGNTFVKTLHSSSHRGLCTLSRCISSVSKDKQREIFGDVTRIANKFSKQQFNKNDI